MPVVRLVGVVPSSSSSSSPSSSLRSSDSARSEEELVEDAPEPVGSCGKPQTALCRLLYHMYVFFTFCTGLFSADELAFLPFGFLGGTLSTRLIDLLLNPGDSELSVSRLSCCRCSDGSGYDVPRNLWENQKPKAKPATREQKQVPINAPVNVWAEYTTGVTVTSVIRLQ